MAAPEGLGEQQWPATATVRLPDLEPVAGLIAACARLSVSLTPEAVAALPDMATDALQAIQGILWRLEHAPVEPSTPDT